LRQKHALGLVIDDDLCMRDAWTTADLQDELDRFERAARAAGLSENSVRTYVDRSRIFVRWLAGEYQFHGPR